nr:uncharacterized protein LOC121125577 isoform X1 [Lepeophtheirus salmonis]
MSHESHLMNLENRYLKQNERISPQLENSFLSSNSTKNRVLTSIQIPLHNTFLLDLSQGNTTENVVENINGKTATDTEFQGMEIQETKSLSSNQETEVFEEILDAPPEMEMYQDEYPKIEKPSLHKGFAEVPISIQKQDPAQLQKFELMQICTTSLLSKPKLHEPEDLIRQKILSLCEEVVFKDSVFILRLYTVDGNVIFEQDRYYFFLLPVSMVIYIKPIIRTTFKNV